MQLFKGTPEAYSSDQVSTTQSWSSNPSFFHSFFSVPLLLVAIYWLDLGDWSQKRWEDYRVVLNSHFIEDHFCFL
jgi:hypothetical protein